MIKLDVVYPDFEKYEGYINANGNINFVDKVKLDRTISTCMAQQQTCQFLMNSQLNILEGGYNKIGTSKDAVRQIFIKHGMPEKFFKSHTTQSGYTFGEEARTKLSEYLKTSDLMNDSDFNVVNYMAMYEDLAEASSIVSSMKKNFSRGKVVPCRDPECKGYKGRELYEMYNIYIRQITGRYYAREVPIVQLPLEVRRCITVPAGYFLLSMDLRQIDMRVAYNMYLRGFYKDDDEQFDKEPEDKYKVMYQIICKHGKIPCDLEWFKDNRGNVKTGILAGMYLAQENKLTQTVGSNEVAKAIREYFDTHEGYQRIVKKIERLYDLAVPFTITDFFGFEIDIEMNKEPEYGQVSTSEDRYSFEEIVKLCISRSIQSTSNSILVNWVNNVMDSLRAEGINDSQLWISAIRHDEPVLCVHKSVIDKLDSLFNAVKVQIADWGVIEFESKVYIYYKDDEETFDGETEILAKYREKIDSYLGKVYQTVQKGEHIPLKCIPNVHEVYCFSLKSPNELFDGKYKGKSNEEISQIIHDEAEKGNLPSVYKKYRDLWDIFVIHNVLTDKYRKFKGIGAIGELFKKFNIQYVKVYTMYGNGVELYGNTMACCTDVEYNATIQILNEALESIKEL